MTLLLVRENFYMQIIFRIAYITAIRYKRMGFASKANVIFVTRMLRKWQLSYVVIVVTRNKSWGARKTVSALFPTAWKNVTNCRGMSY